MPLSKLDGLKVEISIDCLPGSLCHGQRTDKLHLTLTGTNHTHTLGAGKMQILTDWLARQGYRAEGHDGEVTLLLHTKERALDLVSSLQRVGVASYWSSEERRDGRPGTMSGDFELLALKIGHSFDDYHRDQSSGRNAPRSR